MRAVYSYSYMVVDTDDFVAELYTDMTEESLKKCMLKLDNILLSDYVESMTSPFISENFCFRAFVDDGKYHIWYKGFYYYIEDNGAVIKINNFKHRYQQRGSSFINLSFLGICDGVLRLVTNEHIYIEFYDKSATLSSLFEYKEYKNLQGVPMSRKAFLRRVLAN